MHGKYTSSSETSTVYCSGASDASCFDETCNLRGFADQERPSGCHVNSPLEADCASVCHSAASDDFFADPSQTPIFLDWDDSLFPTTEIFDRWKLSRDRESSETRNLSNEQHKMLESWQESLHSYLVTAHSLSECCVIVTNSQRPWVEDCIDRFAPNLKPMFAGPDGIRIVYAREVFAKDKRYKRKLGTGAPVRFASPEVATPEEQRDLCYSWKVAAMRQEAEAFYSKHQGQTWKNILSFGDTQYEYDAAKELSFQRRGPAHEHLRTKIKRSPIEPSISAMAFGLAHGAHTMPLLVNYNGDIDLDLGEGSDCVAEFAKALELPELLEQAPPEILTLCQQSPQSVVPPLSESDQAYKFKHVSVDIVHDCLND